MSSVFSYKIGPGLNHQYSIKKPVKPFYDILESVGRLMKAGLCSIPRNWGLVDDGATVGQERKGNRSLRRLNWCENKKQSFCVYQSFLYLLFLFSA